MYIPEKLLINDPFKKIFNLWNNLIDYLHSAKLIAGNGIKLDCRSSGTIISLAAVNSSHGRSESGSFYNGPFSLLQKEKMLYCYNGQDINASYAGLTTIGSFKYYVPTFQIPIAKGVVYLEIIYSDDTQKYEISLQLADDIPEDDDVHRYCLRIGEVKEQNEFFSISQIWQYGDVEIRGRYVE